MKPLTFLLAEEVTIGENVPDSVSRIIDGIAVLDFPADFNCWVYAQVLLDASEEGHPFTASLELVEPSGGECVIGTSPVGPLTRADANLPVVFNYAGAITLTLPERGLYWIKMTTSTGFIVERPILVGRM